MHVTRMHTSYNLSVLLTFEILCLSISGDISDASRVNESATVVCKAEA